MVGIATVVRTAFPDASDPAGRFVAVELAPVRALKHPVTLAQMKAERRARFANADEMYFCVILEYNMMVVSAMHVAYSRSWRLYHRLSRFHHCSSQLGLDNFSRIVIFCS